MPLGGLEILKELNSFELKDELIELVDENFKGKILNTGR